MSKTPWIRTRSPQSTMRSTRGLPCVEGRRARSSGRVGRTGGNQGGAAGLGMYPGPDAETWIRHWLSPTRLSTTATYSQKVALWSYTEEIHTVQAIVRRRSRGTDPEGRFFSPRWLLNLEGGTEDMFEQTYCATLSQKSDLSHSYCHSPTQPPWEKPKHHEFMLNHQEFEMAEKTDKKGALLWISQQILLTVGDFTVGNIFLFVNINI
ncbi:hypothetical protein B0H14DRAFT_3550960 [Mycena olivaceomarginata]|nr:hypothetical protein B0H14DRAFT_3550960 [Mycena olivaceomarginata]